MADFLNPENQCAQSLLKLVSRGQAILAELQRLSQCIPKIFFERNPDTIKYEQILVDFEYWKDIDKYEDQIQQAQELIDLDEHFRDTYLELLERFFILFESIYLYYSDINVLIEEIHDGVFISYNFENLLQNIEGKKLICEMYYTYGCMLLLMDKLIIGPVREKIVVCYYRYKGGQMTIENLNEVVKLTTKTGYLPYWYAGSAKDIRPKYYPEELFARYSFPEELINQVINTIKDDDIYRYKGAYPVPEHRSFALSQQAGMLYILLFFNGDIMEQKKSKMREIVDKHFYDNWVVPYYLGYYVDLTTEWQDYHAAKKALDNTLDLDGIQDLTNFHVQSLEDSYTLCQEYLIEGVMDEEFVLDNIKDLIKCLTKCNTTIKWLMLHKNSSMKKVRELVTQNLKEKHILSLLMITGQFEGKLQQYLNELIRTKQERWTKDRATCEERMKEVSEVFSGQRSALGSVQQDQTFFNWFTSMKEKIASLEFENTTSVGRKLNQLIQALDDIENYHQLAQNQSIRYYLGETKKDLKHMIKISNIQNTVLTHVSLISDISYAWQCLPEYVPIIQDKIQKHPQNSLLLKFTFQKLSSILNTPMIRIIQAQSQDIESVSKYYSGELIKFVKNIIPREVFLVLQDIIVLLKEKLLPIPWKLKKAELKDLAQYESRKEMSAHIFRISLFTQSILGMETYLVGVIEVNPKEILDEGIRKELIKLIYKVLDDNIVFKQGTIQEFEFKLGHLSKTLQGFKKSIEYIQDFIQTYGIKAFHEEFDRLINCYIDMEQTFFLTGSTQFEELLYDDDIPIPSQANSQPGTVTFMGRLLNALLNLTDQRNAIYIEHSMGFYEIETGREVLTMRSLGLMYRCIGLSGMNGLDKLLCYYISAQMNQIVKLIKKEVNNNTRKMLMDIFDKDLRFLTSFSDKHQQHYAQIKSQMKGLFHELMYRIQKLGQMVLLRKVICLQLQVMAKVGSQRLYLCLENLNNGILNDMHNRIYDKQMSEEDALKENNLLFETSKLFNFIGMSDPLNKIYLTPQHIDNLHLIMYLITSNMIGFIEFDQRIYSLVKRQTKEKKTQNDIEPNFFLHGTLVFLNQFHPHNREIYLGFIAHHIKSQFNQILSDKEPQKQAEQMKDVLTFICIYDELLKISGESENSHLNHLLPIELINSFKKLVK